MTYIDKNLLSGERILFRTKKHLIIFFFPLVLFVFSIFATIYMRYNPILVNLQWAPWFVTLIFFGYTWLEYVTSEFAVTDKRVMMREGFFTRHSNEMRLGAISQVNIDQTLIGQLFNYGTVSINAFGAFDAYTLIAKPMDFQKCVNDNLDKLVK